MCGIAGICHGNDRDPIDLAPLMATMQHRGPDGFGDYNDPLGRLQLGFLRLAIIDLKTGAQPVFSEDRSIVAVVNGEIYNYIELTASLKKRKHRFRSCGDAEVVVHLYEEHGDDFLNFLEGMFAIALWDEKKGRLLLARDQLGIKPLYYAMKQGKVAFASEIKPLLKVDWVTAEVNAFGLSQFLTYEFPLAPNSFFRDIHQLPAAHKLAIEEGNAAEPISYWDCSSPRCVSGDIDEIADRILSKFDHSIALHTRSDVPIGVSLSGGLDSGFIVARAARQYPKLKTYTVSFVGHEFDEAPLAKMVSDRYGTDHAAFRVAPEQMLDELPRILWHCDVPIADSGLLPNYLINERAKSDGVKVMLNGAGGDELFGGYSYYFPYPIEQWALFLAPFSKLLAKMCAFANPSLSHKLARALSYHDNPSAHYLGHVTRWRENEISEFLKSNFMKPDHSRLGHFDRFKGDPLGSRLYADLKTYIADRLMLLLDRTGMAHSIEVRVPFLHHPFVSYVLGIPSHKKAARNEHKGLLKKVVAPFLPEPLMQNPKRGFHSPVQQWMQGEFGNKVLSILLTDKFLGRPWWRKKLMKEFISGAKSRKRNPDKLFRLFILEIYCRIHLDNAASQTPPLSLDEL